VTGDVAERMAAKDQILDVINTWSRAISRRDWDLLRTCYHVDGMDFHGSVDTGVDGFVEWLTAYHEHISQAIFFNTNSIVEFVDSDHAFVETNVLGLQRYTTAARDARAQFLGPDAAEVELNVQFCGRYLDTFERRAGEWRILVRRTVYETVEGSEARGPLPAEGSGLVVARRDADDPLWQARSQAGLKR
jgi:SnoaL-like domain